VINASLGGPVDDLTLAAAAAYAWAHGVLVVAAAGNDSSSLLGYPAALPNVVSVGASTASDELYDFSNTGAAVAAPGENSTTSLGGGYERLLGTSSAAPVVSGIAGLLLGLAPGATPAQLTRALEQSAVPMAGAVYGRVDAQGALNALVPAHPAAPAPLAQQPAPRAGPSTKPASRSVARSLTGRLGRSGRTYSVATARGRLVVRVSLVGMRAAVVRVTVSHGRHRLATRAGRRSVRLGVAVRAGRYRIVVSGPKDRAFRLYLSYPRP
jgi:subtilisin family serine protease